MTARRISHVKFPSTLLLTLTLAACTTPQSTSPPDLAAGPTTREFVVIQLLFARQDPPGTSVGFDLDNYTAVNGDPKTCGHASLTSPTGEKGIDNQMSVFVTALDTQYDHAIDDIIQGGINNGMLMLGVRLRGVDDLMNDDDVSMEVVRLHGLPIVGADKLLVANQTFDVDPATPLAAGHGAIAGGVFQSERFDMRLPVALLTADFTIRLRDALFRIPLAPAKLKGDISPTVLGGTVESQNMLDGLLPLQLDEGFKARMPALFESLADFGRDAQSGKCPSFSAAIQLPLRPAFFAGMSTGSDMGAPIGCGGLLLCLQGCKAEKMCEQACFARTTPTGLTRFDALGACVQHACEPPLLEDGGVPDGGTSPCRFRDDPADACRNCLATAAQSPACRPQFNACFADL